ncbi:hypothetical protein GXM_08429 [Nostoc sphaeroides CCNUC1]|uniref:Uncharacterized protein n=1 Tax=Nostoc sphaeroides CCNUC1 TaxID=2653204 RepID=A0A5P8WDP5_9NOSO|nr:hypothetical protein GXM_08429 [Nostoc sphaeroides CCNUC1]
MDELIAVATGERCKIMVVKRNYILDAYSGVQFSEIQKKCWNDLTARILVFSSNR